MPRAATAERAAPQGVFGRVDQDAIAKDRERTNFFKAQKGENRIRILPPSVEAQTKHNRLVPYVKTYTHFGVGMEGKSAVCPLKSGVRTSCFLCKQLPRLPEKERKDLAPKQRYRLVIWDYANPDKGLQIWEIGYTVKDQLDSIRDKFGEFTDIETGFDIYVDRSGEGMHTKYICQGDRDNTPVDAAIMKWATENGIPELEAGIVIVSDAEMRAAYEGIIDDEEDEEAAQHFEEENRSERRRAVDDVPTLPFETADDDEAEEDEEQEETTEAVAPRSSFSRTPGLTGARTMSAAAAGGTRRFGR
jgi:hypothetical protein